ncbi:hypothetical protein [Microbispora sp. GKU 823]|uniref:hypothetical protein n=1 Tax=Microbispora sp. GKU 823 TaxID=1652100 RepID=UPI0009A3D8CC|nr:hypothetical protein [Microbispora sp. GKU 823]OPG12592.1 hypothetical protein B1L11_13570 [Microbispora sp. GKU 823]
MIFAVNSLGIVLAGRLNSVGTRRLSPRILLGGGIERPSWPGWGLPVLLPALFLVVSSLGVVLGAAQFLLGAVVPPLISGDGATAITLTVGIVVVGTLALVVHAGTRGPTRA